MIRRDLAEEEKKCQEIKMQYQNVQRAVFLSRPNRFVARIKLDGQEEICHVKNTGRCRELLIPGSEISVQRSENLDRKTKFDLIAVRKKDQWVNIDSQIPNRVVEEWIKGSGLFSSKAVIRREKTYKSSRFDLYVEDGDRKVYIEVKGVTLEEEHTARFPDAPTLRGVKHLEELIRCMEDGYEACLIFVIQMKGVRHLEPNWDTHPEFARTLKKAKEAGVRILTYDCQVGEDYIWMDQPVPVVIQEGRSR